MAQRSSEPKAGRRVKMSEISTSMISWPRHALP